MVLQTYPIPTRGTPFSSFSDKRGKEQGKDREFVHRLMNFFPEMNFPCPISLKTR
jgi:hypothetical protein